MKVNINWNAISTGIQAFSTALAALALAFVIYDNTQSQESQRAWEKSRQIWDQYLQAETNNIKTNLLITKNK